MAAGIATPAAAVVTFASFTSTTSVRNVRFISAPTTSRFISTLATNGTVAAPAPFIFTVFDAPSALSAVAATFTLDATLPSAGAVGGFSLANMTGSFSIIVNSVLTAGNATGTNLLSGTFTGGSLNGSVGDGSGGVTASTVGGSTISFTSDFLNFSNVVDSDLSCALSAVNSPFGNTNAPPRLRNFRASLGGQFSAEPVPRLLVPEPATWAMLVLGFGLVGVSVRRRRNVVVA